MSAVASTLYQAVRTNKLRWLGITLGFATVYNLILLGAAIARFGHWPNYWRVHDMIDGVRLIFRGTSDPGDLLDLLAAEIWLEIGYMHPSFGIAEWSFNLMPARLTLVMATGALVATYAALSRNCAATGQRRTAVTASAGAALIALTSATLTWVVCCATPSWVVGLAMLGLGVSTSLALEPVGTPLAAAGFAMLLAAVLVRARALSPASHLESRSPLEMMP
jgi:hypothetical protein